MNRICLKQGETVGLRRAAGMALRVAGGDVWLTQPRDELDHMLKLGDCFQVATDGEVLIYAFEDSQVEMAGSGTVVGIWQRGAAALSEPQRLRRAAILRVATPHFA